MTYPLLSCSVERRRREISHHQSALLQPNLILLDKTRHGFGPVNTRQVGAGHVPRMREHEGKELVRDSVAS
jgi:hypothetical protein